MSRTKPITQNDITYRRAVYAKALKRYSGLSFRESLRQVREGGQAKKELTEILAAYELEKEIERQDTPAKKLATLRQPLPRWHLGRSSKNYRE